jgi:hypothetical protein
MCAHVSILGYSNAVQCSAHGFDALQRCSGMHALQHLTNGVDALERLVSGVVALQCFTNGVDALECLVSAVDALQYLTNGVDIL